MVLRAGRRGLNYSDRSMGGGGVGGEGVVEVGPAIGASVLKDMVLEFYQSLAREDTRRAQPPEIESDFLLVA